MHSTFTLVRNIKLDEWKSFDDLCHDFKYILYFIYKFTCGHFNVLQCDCVGYVFPTIYLKI